MTMSSDPTFVNPHYNHYNDALQIQYDHGLFNACSIFNNFLFLFSSPLFLKCLVLSSLYEPEATPYFFFEVLLFLLLETFIAQLSCENKQTCSLNNYSAP